MEGLCVINPSTKKCELGNITASMSSNLEARFLSPYVHKCFANSVHCAAAKEMPVLYISSQLCVFDWTQRGVGAEVNCDTVVHI